MRADVYLYTFGYVKSRQKAKTLIESGYVYLNGDKILKPATELDENLECEIEVKDPCPYVSRGGLKLEKILNVTAKYYGVSAEDIKSRKKTDNIANARHIACFIIRKITELPYDTIGGFIGRDHSTVMASISKVEINIKTKKNTDSDIKKIIKEIKS